jgi:hypothetical protein
VTFWVAADTPWCSSVTLMTPALHAGGFILDEGLLLADTTWRPWDAEPSHDLRLNKGHGLG